MESRARSYLCPFFVHPQREKGKNPAQLNKQLDWGRVEWEWVKKNLRKRENGVAKERGCHIQPGSCAADRLQSRRARSNIPYSKVQRTSPRLHAPQTRDTDTAKAGLFFKASLYIIKGSEPNQIKISIMPQQLCCLLRGARSEEDSGKAAASASSLQSAATARRCWPRTDTRSFHHVGKAASLRNQHRLGFHCPDQPEESSGWVNPEQPMLQRSFF